MVTNVLVALCVGQFLVLSHGFKLVCILDTRPNTEIKIYCDRYWHFVFAFICVSTA